jgi:hypothetical protein
MKEKIYIEKVKDYYKFKLKPDTKRLKVGLYGTSSFYVGKLYIKDEYVDLFKEKYQDRVVYKHNSFGKGLNHIVHISEEELFNDLPTMFDIEMIAPAERISQTKPMPKAAYDILKEYLRNPDNYEGETVEIPTSRHVEMWFKRVIK